jgi:opacity protein-like surface antigen
MKGLNVSALAVMALCGSAQAADFAMMETAEHITQGSFKLSGAPVLIDRDRASNDGGFIAGLGYGLGHDLDLEGQLAAYEDGTWVGADLEWRAWREGSTAFSIGGGLHGADLDGGGSAAGAEATAIFTYMPVHRLALSAALDATYDDVNNRDASVPADARFPTDGQYDRYYAVPGVDYQLTHNLDLLAEIGLGLNADSDNYVSGGMSWYFR